MNYLLFSFSVFNIPLAVFMH